MAGGNGAGGWKPRPQGFHLPGKQNDRTSLRQSEGVFGGHGQLRDVVQRGLDRKQGLQKALPYGTTPPGFPVLSPALSS